MGKVGLGTTTGPEPTFEDQLRYFAALQAIVKAGRCKTTEMVGPYTATVLAPETCSKGRRLKF
jgi:hypothetical protein